MEKLSMISIPKDATTFDLCGYYNLKMENLSFLEMWNVPIYLWSANDHEVPDSLRVPPLPHNYRYHLP
jgi:hypothetical protein